MFLEAGSAGRNLSVMVGFSSMIFRMLAWALEPRHFTRVGKERVQRRTVYEILCDAADLCINARGIGWDFSQPYAHTIPAARNVRYFGIPEYLAYSIPFDCLVFALPYIPALFCQRYIQLGTWLAMSAQYTQYRLIALFVFGQKPEEWPQLFDEPYRATSLAQLWGRRWHQCFRYFLTRTGGRLFSLLGGSRGMVFGSFLLSGIYHDTGMWGLAYPQGLCCRTTIFFVMSGVGVVVEALWKRKTGRKVAGFSGWLWTMVWIYFSVRTSMTEECMRMLYHHQMETNYPRRPIYGCTILLREAMKRWG